MERPTLPLVPVVDISSIIGEVSNFAISKKANGPGWKGGIALSFKEEYESRRKRQRRLYVLYYLTPEMSSARIP
jgi:hypothetical protein